MIVNNMLNFSVARCIAHSAVAAVWACCRCQLSGAKSGCSNCVELGGQSIDTEVQERVPVTQGRRSCIMHTTSGLELKQMRPASRGLRKEPVQLLTVDGDKMDNNRCSDDEDADKQHNVTDVDET